MDIKKFDKFLSEASTQPEWVLVHPTIWNGYWNIRHRPAIVQLLFRWLGRKLHSKYIYWIGLPVEWVIGLKEFYTDVDPEEIIL